MDVPVTPLLQTYDEAPFADKVMVLPEQLITFVWDVTKETTEFELFKGILYAILLVP